MSTHRVPVAVAVAVAVAAVALAGALLYGSGRRTIPLSAAAGPAADFATLTAAAPAVPHFMLLEPASWLIGNDRSDPQKAGPCGGTNTNWGTESYIVTPVTGGSKLHLKLTETTYHPGHYRVALAVNSMTELPPDPEVATRDTERGPRSVSAVIQDPPVPPVLADGLFPHDTRPESPQTYEADIDIPNLDCDRCVLQVIQFMAYRLQQSGRLQLPPLRDAQGDRRSVQADRHEVVGAAPHGGVGM